MDAKLDLLLKMVQNTGTDLGSLSTNLQEITDKMEDMSGIKPATSISIPNLVQALPIPVVVSAASVVVTMVNSLQLRLSQQPNYPQRHRCWQEIWLLW